MLQKGYDQLTERGVDPISTTYKHCQSGKRWKEETEKDTMIQNSHESRRKSWATALAQLVACSLAPPTHLLAPYRLLCSWAPLCSFVRSIAHGLTPELVGKGIINA